MGGEYGERPQNEVNETVDRAIELGVNYFDTSPYYGRTRSEEALGIALSGKRDQIFLSTKTGRFDVDAFDFTEKRLCAEVDNSLRRLKTDHVDLLIAHDIEFADPSVVLYEGLPTLQALKEAGKTRFIGVSGLPLHVLQTAHEQFPHMDAILSLLPVLLERHGADSVCGAVARGRSRRYQRKPALHGAADAWRTAGVAPGARAIESGNERSCAMVPRARRPISPFLGMQFAFQCPAGRHHDDRHGAAAASGVEHRGVERAHRRRAAERGLGHPAPRSKLELGASGIERAWRHI